MTAPECATGCGRPSPSAAICGECAGELRRALAMAASISGALEEAVARQASHGPGARGSRERPLPLDLGAMAARDELRKCLLGWVDVISEVSPYWQLPADDVAVLAFWLRHRMLVIAQHQAAPDIHREVIGAVQRAVRILEPPPERHPAGECECGRQLYAEPGADHADCPCGTTTTGIIAARRKRAADADVLGTATEVAGALQKLGICVNAGTIRMWASRGRITQRPGGAYAMSDVLHLIAERDARR